MVKVARQGLVRGINPAKFACLAKDQPLRRRSEMKRLGIGRASGIAAAFDHTRMKVVLFCGGQGMRLREMPQPVPKPMAVIGYRPLLWHLMKYYSHFGHNEFVLCLGYGADVIKETFLNYNECVPPMILFSRVVGRRSSCCVRTSKIGVLPLWIRVAMRVWVSDCCACEALLRRTTPFWRIMPTA